MKRGTGIIAKLMYSLLFTALCVIDQIVGSQGGRVQFVAINCIGPVVAVLIFSNYYLKDFLKLPYFIWTGVFLVGGTIASVWGIGNYPYPGKYITAVLNVGIYGYLVLRLIFLYFVEKRERTFRGWFMILWVIMIVLMVVSPYEDIWPLWFGVMFGGFYLTPMRKGRWELYLDSLCNGVIVAFFLIQGAAFVFRPYDLVRYQGMYANCNVNALFYLYVYMAFLGKWAICSQKQSKIGFRIVNALFAGAMFGFQLLTGTKTVMISMLLVTAWFLICMFVSDVRERVKKRVGRLFLRGAILAAVAVISVPITYGAVRYLPALFHHPIWFGGEYREEAVHSFDPIDSDKYISFEEMLSGSVGRLLWFVNTSENGEEASAETESVEDVSLKAEYISADADNTEGRGLISDEEVNNPITLRMAIYKTYFAKLRLWGHSSTEDGLWLTDTYFAPHAHDFLLQMAFSFGIPVALMMLSIVISVLVMCIRLLKKGNVPAALIAGGFVLAFFSFGLFEISWRIGMVGFTLFFLLLKMVADKNENRGLCMDYIEKVGIM